MNKNNMNDEFFDIQDIISQALNSIGGDMDDVTGGIVKHADEDRLLLSLYSITEKKDAAKFQKKFFETIEAALANTRFNDVSRDEDHTYAYRLTRHNIEDMLGSERAKEFLDKFAMFEILITAYSDGGEGAVLTESASQVAAIEELDSCLAAGEISENQYAAASKIAWDINFEDVLLFINGIDVPLSDVKHVAYGECDESEFDGCYEVLLHNGTVKNYGWHDFDLDGRLTPISDAINEWNEFSDDDVEDDIMHANVYGGDTKYCRHCGELKIWDADGFSYCPECDGDNELTETYWIDNKPVMDKVAELQAELEADGWTQNGDRYTGSKYYSFYMKRGDGKAQWKAIRYSHTDEPEIIDVTYRQAIGSEPLDSIDGLRKTLGKMLLPNNESVQATKSDKEDVELNESPRGFYVTTYYPDERWSPEEGGTMDYGWQADKSKFFRTEEEAQKYLDDKLVGMEIKTKYEGSYQYEDEYGDLQMIAIEPSGKRGKWHSPARSWTQIEFDVPAERPYFNRRGDRVEGNPRKDALARKKRKELADEFLQKVQAATTLKELVEVIADAKYDRVSRNEENHFPDVVIDKIKSLQTAVTENLDSLKSIIDANLSKIVDRAFEQGLDKTEIEDTVMQQLKAVLAAQIEESDDTL